MDVQSIKKANYFVMAYRKEFSEKIALSLFETPKSPELAEYLKKSLSSSGMDLRKAAIEAAKHFGIKVEVSPLTPLVRVKNSAVQSGGLTEMQWGVLTKCASKIDEAAGEQAVSSARVKLPKDLEAAVDLISVTLGEKGATFRDEVYSSQFLRFSK